MMTENTAELALVLVVVAGLLVLKQPRLPATESDDGVRHAADPEARLLLLLIVMTMVLTPVLDLLAPWIEFADSTFRTGMAWAGTATGCVTVWLFWRAETDRLQARRLSLPVMEVGIYRYIRHPFYSGMLLWGLTQWLLLQNWLAGPAAAITFLLVYVLRAPRDEQALLERFGHRYLDYMTCTGGLWPRWKGRRKT